jgi:hypothetical protein
MISIITSTIVFYIISVYLKRYLDDMAIPKGFTRGIIIFTVAAFGSWMVGAGIDWVQGSPETASPLSLLPLINNI